MRNALIVFSITSMGIGAGLMSIALVEELYHVPRSTKFLGYGAMLFLAGCALFAYLMNMFT